MIMLAMMAWGAMPMEDEQLQKTHEQFVSFWKKNLMPKLTPVQQSLSRAVLADVPGTDPIPKASCLPFAQALLKQKKMQVVELVFQAKKQAPQGSVIWLVYSRGVAGEVTAFIDEKTGETLTVLSTKNAMFQLGS